MDRIWHLVIAVGCAVAVVVAIEAYQHGWLTPQATKPVQITGILLHGGLGLPGASISFDRPGNVRAATVRTGRGGRFKTQVDQPGDYLLAIAMSDRLSSTSREVTVRVGDNDLVVDVPGTSIDFAVAPPDGVSPDLVQVVLVGPSSPASWERVGFVRLSENFKGRFVGVGYGEYHLAAYVPSEQEGAALRGARMETVVLSTGRPNAAVKLTLVNRPRRIEVADIDGTPVNFAEVRTLRRTLKHQGSGRFRADDVSTGQHLLVLAPGQIPLCVKAQEVPVQTVQIRPKEPHSFGLRLVDGPGRPVGLLERTPGSECGVPLAVFEPDWKPDSPTSILLSVSGLPTGTFQYRATPDAEARQLTSPGPVVSYLVPPTCRFCGGNP